MKQPAATARVHSLELDRRGFLTGVGVALGTLPLQTFAAADTGAALASAAAQRTAAARGTGQRAIHQDLAYIDHDGLGRPYDAPRGNQSTRDYINSLTQEEFLRRHWFS